MSISPTKADGASANVPDAAGRFGDFGGRYIPETLVMAAAHDEMVHDLLEVLEPRARHAVEQRFGLLDGQRRSYREVGEELGVTAEAARRLVKRAVTTVRDTADPATIDAA